MHNVKPINYKIRIAPDLENFKFDGRVEILVKAAAPVNEITLNSLELVVSSCKVKLGTQYADCPFFTSPQNENMRISLPNEMVGHITLRIEYLGHINDKMVGFYRNKYLKNGRQKYSAVTQFEESDARRAFPCFDHPVKKATFDIEMIVDQGLVAISNEALDTERYVGKGKKSVTFQQTPMMSTYLLFFGAGEFEFIEDSKDVRVRVVTMPGMKKYAHFGLEFGRKCLEFCEKYYGIRYPLRKLDLISIPDFAFGAMENWGAITFRENLLLHYPGKTSRAGEERICEIIAHEIAHQWFGNLVTPSDWKYLWLNESFATYFGYGVVSHYYPEWGIWEQFLHSHTETSLDRDAFQETFPIEIPGGEHVVINTSTAPIIYSKGGSILRQIKGYIGDDCLKKGLRHYLKKHEYACASSHHLWESFEEVSEKPITHIMKSWIEQQGFPVVEVKRSKDKLILTQKRFTYLATDAHQQWLIPTTLRIFYANGNSRSLTTLLSSESTTVHIGDNAIMYKLNDGQTGFYRVKYLDEDVFCELGKAVFAKKLPSTDRWGLQNDLYALVKAGDASIDEYTGFLSNYIHEDSFLPLVSIAQNLFHAYMVVKGRRKEEVRAIGKSLFEKVLAEIGYEPARDEKTTISILRDQIIWHAVLYGSRDVKDFALSQFSKLMRGDTIHPDIMKAVMQVGALNGDAQVFEWFDKSLNSSDSEHERINILMALGNFADNRILERVQQYILDKVPNRNKFVPIVSMATNPHAAPFMWNWYRTQLEALEQFHPLHYERVVASIIPVCGLGREEKVISFFTNYMRQKDLAREVIKLSLERLQVNSRMRELSEGTN